MENKDSTERNWLIRTKHFQILGPVSKNKIVEFIEKGSLSGDDEICSGNGYWFSISESDLVDKYIFGNVPQSFNPISEAATILFAHPEPVTSSGGHELQDENTLPAQEDLEFPQLEAVASEQEQVAVPEQEQQVDEDQQENTDDHTQAINIEELNLKRRKTDENDLQQAKIQAQAVMAELAASCSHQEDETVPGVPMKGDDEEVIEEDDDNVEDSAEENILLANKSVSKKKTNDYFLYVILIASGAILLFSLYYYSKVLNRSFFSLISSANAQESSFQAVTPQFHHIIEKKNAAKVFQTSYGSVELQIDLRGGSINVTSLEIPESCSDFNQYVFQFLFVYYWRGHPELFKDDGWSSKVNECRQFISPGSFATILRWLSGESLVLESDELYSIKKLRQENKNLSVFYFNEVINNSFYSQESFEKRAYAHKKLLNDLEGLSSYPFLYHLARIYIGGKISNIGMVKNSLRQLVSFHSMRYVFNVSSYQFSDATLEDYRKNLEDVIVYVNSSRFPLKDEALKQIFNKHLYAVINDRELQRILSRYINDWSLSQVRTISQGRTRPERIPETTFFWAKQIYGRAIQSEFFNYFNNQLSVNVISNMGIDNFLIFHFILPQSTELQEEILNVTLMHINDNFSRYLLSQFSYRHFFREIFETHAPQLVRPEFQVKNEIYENFFGNNIATEYMIFHLFKSGHYRPEFLWWAING